MTCEILCAFFLGGGQQPPSGPWPPHFYGFYVTHNVAPQSVGLLWTSDQLVAENSTLQHTTLITDKYPCPRWDSNSQGERPHTNALYRAATGTGLFAL